MNAGRLKTRRLGDTKKGTAKDCGHGDTGGGAGMFWGMGTS